MYLRRDGWYQADEGKYFVLTEKGKENSASYRDKTVGEPVSEYDTEATKHSVDAGYLIEVSIPDWVEKKGYRVVYNYDGHILPVGNPVVFPELEIAEKYKENYSKGIYSEHELYIEDAIFKGRALKECREYDGKKVYNRSWYYGPKALFVGDLVEAEIVEDIINALPPACMKFDCIQLGEPAGMTIDEQGNVRSTFVTFKHKNLTDSVFEYCGECIRGRNTNSYLP